MGTPVITGPWTLRQESKESWEHFVSDITLYLCDFTLPNFDGIAGEIDWFTEYKLGRVWFEYDAVLHGNRPN